MNSLYDVVVSLLGTPPNDIINTLYYVLCVFLVIYFIKLITLFLRIVFGIPIKQ